MQDVKFADQKPGCYTIGLCVLLIAVGIKWMIFGEISIPYQGIHVTGVAARFVALLLIVFCMQPIWTSIRRRGRRLSSPGGPPELK